MELEVDECYITDLDDWENWTTKKPEEIYFPLDISIGIKGKPGSDYFDVLIATPESIKKYMISNKKEFYKFLRHVLLVTEYNWSEIVKSVNEIVKKCQRPTWEESVEQLCRYFHWEYEDHEYDEE